jgi:hypothetical protein
MSTAAIERIVVQTTSADKRSITKKAKQTGFTVSELMRRAVASYSPSEDPELLDQLALEATQSADRACAAMDDAIAFVRQADAGRAAKEAALRAKLKAELGAQI